MFLRSCFDGAHIERNVSQMVPQFLMHSGSEFKDVFLLKSACLFGHAVQCGCCIGTWMFEGCSSSSLYARLRPACVPLQSNLPVGAGQYPVQHRQRQDADGHHLYAED